MWCLVHLVKYLSASRIKSLNTETNFRGTQTSSLFRSGTYIIYGISSPSKIALKSKSKDTKFLNFNNIYVREAQVLGRYHIPMSKIDTLCFHGIKYNSICFTSFHYSLQIYIEVVIIPAYFLKILRKCILVRGVRILFESNNRIRFEIRIKSRIVRMPRILLQDSRDWKDSKGFEGFEWIRKDSKSLINLKNLKDTKYYSRSNN